MSKTYQPFIITLSEELIEILDTRINFFKDEGILSTDYAKEAICDLLTEKFLKGEITSDITDQISFNEEEFSTLLNKIITENALKGLINKGLINYLEDDNGEEMFFLTANGKEYAKNLLDDENKKNKSEENE